MDRRHSHCEVGRCSLGNVFEIKQNSGCVLAAADLKVPPEFKNGLVYNVPKATQGSWVSLTIDDKQRFIAGNQEGGIYRITPKEGAGPKGYSTSFTRFI